MPIKHLVFLSILFTTFFSINAQQTNRTQILNKNIKTLQAKVNGDALKLPIITLGSEDALQISFDNLSHEIQSFSYRVRHCNADWTLSEISTNEYLSGFTNGRVEDYKTSINTTVLYTHYAFQLPNNDMNFKISGNYVVEIYKNNETENPVSTLCFSVVEPRADILANVRGNTDTELNGRLQQLDFDVMLKGYYVRDPHSEIKVVVRQNNRPDNQVTRIKPTFFSSDKLTYNNNRSLIFEGGNEYRRFDISSIYNYSERINTIRYVNPYYQAYLFPDEVNTRSLYQHDFDVNGKFVINYQNHPDDEIMADYIYVNFFLKKDAPFFDGAVFLGGEYNYNQMNESNRMDYDMNEKMYTKSVLLKQGGYNYQYWFRQKGEEKATAASIEGSFWQTQNQYAIYIYHRGFGERYDKLIGVKVFP